MKALLCRVNIYTLLILSRIDARWYRASRDYSVWSHRVLPWFRVPRGGSRVAAEFFLHSPGSTEDAPQGGASSEIEGDISGTRPTWHVPAVEQLALCVLQVTTRHSPSFLRAVFGIFWRPPSLLLQCLQDLEITNEEFLQLWSALQGPKDVQGALLWIKELSH